MIEWPEKLLYSLLDAVRSGELLPWAIEHSHQSGAVKWAWSNCMNDALMRALLRAMGIYDADRLLCDKFCSKPDCQSCCRRMRETVPELTIEMVAEATKARR